MFLLCIVFDTGRASTQWNYEIVFQLFASQPAEFHLITEPSAFANLFPNTLFTYANYKVKYSRQNRMM